MYTKSIAALIVFAIAPFLWPLPAAAQITIIPGSAEKGAELFRQKSCSGCHSFDGTSQGRTPMQLAAALWNHSAEMWRSQGPQNARPALDSMQAADLFSYFFSLAYFTAPGNPAKGRDIFQAKGCSACHDTTIGPRRSGPPIAAWSSVDDPLAWADRMWNHSKNVYTALAAGGTPWPRFSTEEMVDMLAYLRAATETPSHSVDFKPGDPEKGRTTFERSCETCHSFGSKTAQPKIDLLKKPVPDLMTGYVVAMWNHAPLMHKSAPDHFPVLGPGDMSNLVAYLFAERSFYEEGNASRGEKVFVTKRCVSCHEQKGRLPGATDLTAATERYSPITISAALFRHGAAMFDAMEKKNVPWPRFTPRDMSDLITYLNSRLVIRVAERRF